MSDFRFDEHFKEDQREQKTSNIKKYEEENSSRVLYLIDVEGSHWAFHYSQINIQRYIPTENVIKIFTSSYDITLTGGNLLQLFQDLSEQMVKMVIAVDKRYALMQPDNESFVTDIIISLTEN